MPKLTTRDIRERTIELLRANADGMRYLDLVRTIAAESPETPYGTVYAQVSEVPNRHADLVFRPKRGLFMLREAGERPGPGKSSEASFPRTVETLKRLEFVPAGTWAVDGPHLRCDFFDHERRCPSLYAFVCAGEVMYLGKSVVPLSRRIAHYGKPGPSQWTNQRVNARIRDLLADGQSVGIWALVDWEPLEHCGIPINVAAGIEDALIERMAPPWNGGRQVRG